MTLTAAYLDEFAEPVGYLEFAAIGPMSRRVRAAVADGYAAVAEPSGQVAPPMVQRWNDARAAMGRLFGVPGEWCTGIHATSAGLFQVAFGLLGHGGNVVVPSHEFPANVYPWLRAEAVGGPEVRLVDVGDHCVTPDALAAAVDADTRAIAVSLVDFRTGYRCDPEALRELSSTALLVVDAIQGLGAVEYQMGSADVVVAAGQKWMRSGWGSGVLAVAPRASDMLDPVLTGWYGVEDFLDTDVPPIHPPRRDADRYHTGSPAIFGAYAFAAAIEVIELVGIAAIESAISERIDDLETVLQSAGAEVFSPWRSPAERAGIMCFRLPRHDPTDVAKHLHAAGLVVSDRGGWIRLAPHASTSHEVAGMLAEALDAL